ncbi:MAG: DUF2231 domain-containing protein [Phycisphaerales bacterium]
MFPPLPPINGLHPIVVHFPIAILLIAPVFLVLAGASKRPGAMAASALIMLVLGAAFTFLAAMTGEAAEDQAEGIAAARAVLERHEELGGIARFVFGGLALLYAGIVAFALWSKDRLKRPLWIATHAGFLLLHAGTCLLLANVAHDGGRLVHEFGVRAPIAGGAPPAAVDPATSHHDDDD